MAQKAVKRKPPARQRYEARNPVISGRVPVEVKQRLDTILVARGITFGKWMVETLDGNGVAAAVADTGAVYRRGYQEGFTTAWEMLYEIIGDTCLCCGAPTLFPEPSEA